MADTVKTITIKINGEDALVDLNEIKKALKETTDNTKELKNTNLSNFNSQLGTLTDSFKNGEIGVKGLAKGVLQLGKAMLTAFVTNPVLLAIGAIVAAVAGLVAVFKSFKPVTDWIENKFAAMTAVWTTFKTAVIDVATGNKSLKESFIGLGSSMSEAAKEAENLRDAERELEDSALALEVANAKADTQIQKLITQSRDLTKTDKERMDLIDEAMMLEAKQHDANMKQANETERVTFDKMILGKKLSDQEKRQLLDKGILYARTLQQTKDISDEEIEAWGDALIAKEKMLQGSNLLVEKSQNRRNQIAEESRVANEAAAAKSQAAAEKAAAEKEKREADSNAFLEKVYANIEKIENKKISNYNAEIERDKKTKEFEDSRITDYDKAIIAIKQKEDLDKKFMDQRASRVANYEATKPDEIRQLNSWRAALFTFDTFEKRIADERLAREVQTAQEIYDVKKASLTQESTNAALSIDQREAALERLKDLEIDYYITTTRFNDLKAQNINDNLRENVLVQVKSNEEIIHSEDSTFAYRQFVLDRHLELLDDTNVKIVLGEQEIFEATTYYNKLKLDLIKEEAKVKKEAQDKQLQDVLDTVNMLGEADRAFTDTAINNQKLRLQKGKISQEQYDKEVAKIQEKAAKREKAYAVAAAIINTAQGISKALASSPPPMNFILAAAVGVLGAAQIAKILSTPTKADSTSGSGGLNVADTTTGSAGTSPNTSFSFSPTTESPTNQALKTYVLGKDVATQAQLDRQIVANGTI